MPPAENHRGAGLRGGLGCPARRVWIAATNARAISESRAHFRQRRQWTSKRRAVAGSSFRSQKEAARASASFGHGSASVSPAPRPFTRRAPARTPDLAGRGFLCSTISSSAIAAAALESLRTAGARQNAAPDRRASHTRVPHSNSAPRASYRQYLPAAPGASMAAPDVSAVERATCPVLPLPTASGRLRRWLSCLPG
jgi:hypothetical protein